MALQLDLDHPYFQISLQSEDDGTPSLFDISTFLYDFAMAYEISRLATDPTYEHVEFSRFVLYRNRFRIREQDRMFVWELRSESPFELTLVLAAVPIAIGALWGIVQIVEKITNWPLNRRKLRAEVEKLERENRSVGQSNIRLVVTEKQFENLLARRNGKEVFELVRKRLAKSPIRIVNIEIRRIDRLEKK